MLHLKVFESIYRQLVFNLAILMLVATLVNRHGALSSPSCSLLDVFYVHGIQLCVLCPLVCLGVQLTFFYLLYLLSFA